MMYIRIISSAALCVSALVALTHGLPAASTTASVSTKPLLLNGTDLGGHHKNMSADAEHLMDMNTATPTPCHSTCKTQHVHQVCTKPHNSSDHCSLMHPKPAHMNMTMTGHNMTMPCRSSCNASHAHTLCSKVRNSGEKCIFGVER
jgi:hypothetical protein